MSDALIVSVSGVRGIVGTSLTPEVAERYATAFGALIRESGGRTAVLARDARASGPMFADVVGSALQSVGVSVIDCGLIPTPTAQLAVEHHGAAGGIVITASHNPVEWNALKFVGPDGLFLSRKTAGRLFELAANPAPETAAFPGDAVEDEAAVERHLDAVMGLDLIDVTAIRRRRFTVALDCVRGAGGNIMPQLLDRLACRTMGMDLEPDGMFPRLPEPVPENLSGLGELVRRAEADVGIAVDPDVDRLAVVDETGTPIGEDYTLAFAVREVLARRTGVVVTNLSTSLVVEDAARDYGAVVRRAPVGEANVAALMQQVGAVIGGEGNGGVMLPDLHLGRDAPVAAGLVLSLMARTGRSVAELVRAAPRYAIVKAKVGRQGSMEGIYQSLQQRFSDATVDRQDGLRLAWGDSWLHVRPSGTEPIVRLIAEAPTSEAADTLVSAAKEYMSS
ncbi:MAG: phosphoglucosamine mutase [Gemmatimonadota bacterium]|nr:MAG: phosphoglucosamine mutase [Gemmatimonadota bacterium]